MNVENLKRNNGVLWLDLETTGLDGPEISERIILEVSAIVADENYNEIDVFSRIIHYDRAYALSKMNDWCKKTHTELLDEVVASTFTFEQVKHEFIEFIKKNFPNVKPRLAGNTIAFDKNYLVVHMPEVVNMIHHRTVDPSGMLDSLFLFDSLKYDRKVPKHRGLADVRSSMVLHKQVRAAAPLAKVHLDDEDVKV